MWQPRLSASSTGTSVGRVSDPESPRSFWHIARRKPDILTLQELPARLLEEVRSALQETGLPHLVYAQAELPVSGRDRIRHGVLIAARWPVRKRLRWTARARYAELLARASVEWPGHPDGVDVYTAHIPNGSSNGWVKVQHLQILAEALMASPDAPRILTGDFNEPQAFRSSGQLVPFSTRMTEDGSVGRRGFCRKNTSDGEPRPWSEWARAVRDVLSSSSHGLRNVYEVKHGMVPTPVTHVVAKKPRCFDHGFASRHFHVIRARYHHD